MDRMWTMLLIRRRCRTRNQLFLVKPKSPIPEDHAAISGRNQLTPTSTSKSISAWTRSKKFNISLRSRSHNSNSELLPSNPLNNSMIQGCISLSKILRSSIRHSMMRGSRCRPEASWKTNSKWCSTNRDTKNLSHQSSSRNHQNSLLLLRGHLQSSLRWT